MSRNEKTKGAIHIASSHSSITGICFNRILYIDWCKEISLYVRKKKIWTFACVVTNLFLIETKPHYIVEPMLKAKLPLPSVYSSVNQ